MSEHSFSQFRQAIEPAMEGIAVISATLALAIPSAEASRSTSHFRIDGAEAQGALSLNASTGLGRCAVKVRADETNYGQQISGLMKMEDKVSGQWVEDQNFDPLPIVTATPTSDGNSYKFIATHRFSVREMLLSARSGPLRLACYAGNNVMTTQISARELTKPTHGKSK